MSNSWEETEDQRNKGSKYPNYNLLKTPSGHSVMFDDTKGNESVTIQHRSGSLVQMQADGTVVMRNRKNKTEVTFGDNKMMINGHWDITVNGGASMKVEGNYDVNVNGDYKLSVNGKYDVVVNGDNHHVVKGKVDYGVGKAYTVKVLGNIQVKSGKKLWIGSKSGNKVESTEGSNVADPPFS